MLEFRLRAIILSTGLCALAFSKVACAAYIVAPNALADVVGNQANSYPFPTTAWAEHLRYQQIFDSVEFSMLTGPSLITQIALRQPAQPFGNVFTSTIANIQINLSTTARSPDNLSLVFANNVGLDDSLVYLGPLTISTANLGPQDGPKQFDAVINLQTPFLYDPALGSLLLETRNFTGGSIFQAYGYDAHYDPNDSISRVGGLVDGDTALFSDTVGVVVRFNVEPVSVVPEPSASWLLGLGFLGLLGMARRKAA